MREGLGLVLSTLKVSNVIKDNKLEIWIESINNDSVLCTNPNFNKMLYNLYQNNNNDDDDDELTRTIKRMYIQNHKPDSFISIKRFIKSTHIIKGMEYISQRLARKYPEEYTICIQYLKKKIPIKVLWDIQLGITETITKNEYNKLQNNSNFDNIYPIIKRAVREEFNKNICNAEYNIYDKFNENGRDIYGVSLHIDDKCIVEHVQNVKSADNSESSINRSKLLLFIHGPLNIMKNIFEFFATNEKQIGCYVLIKNKDIPNYFFNSPIEI
jgi:hypothetical protein